jgi:hypothetical protein
MGGLYSTTTAPTQAESPELSPIVDDRSDSVDNRVDSARRPAYLPASALLLRTDG